MSKHKDIIRLGLALSTVSLVLWWIFDEGLLSSTNWDTLTSEYIAIFGYMFLLGISILYFKQELDILKSTLFGAMIGVSFAAITQYFYSNNIWMDTVITGDNVLWEIQLVIIVFWIIIGIIKGA